MRKKVKWIWLAPDKVEAYRWNAAGHPLKSLDAHTMKPVNVNVPYILINILNKSRKVTFLDHSFCLCLSLYPIPLLLLFILQVSSLLFWCTENVRGLWDCGYKKQIGLEGNAPWYLSNRWVPAFALNPSRDTVISHNNGNEFYEGENVGP